MGVRAKLLIDMVGAWGFEPQTPTVSTWRMAEENFCLASSFFESSCPYVSLVKVARMNYLQYAWLFSCLANSEARIWKYRLLYLQEVTLQEVKESLESSPDYAASDVLLELRTGKARYRSIDPTILVAIVGAAGTGIESLITGLLQGTSNFWPPCASSISFLADSCCPTCVERSICGCTRGAVRTARRSELAPSDTVTTNPESRSPARNVIQFDTASIDRLACFAPSPETGTLIDRRYQYFANNLVMI